MKVAALFILGCLVWEGMAKPEFPEQEKDPDFWKEWAQRTLKNALTLQDLNKNVAKNIILFLGDGMGVPTVTAARILKGQLSGQNGEETQLEMDKFPYVALSKVHPTCCNPIIPFLCVHNPCSRSPRATENRFKS
ncbi:alkaline phosphatase-like [Sinocyclocheilus rhinocerous]|uniref:alkaline phosphatase-like n=1 Tax=Sinocyclocheilus rhinocerous TaxID=307959 RepID=UPI0007B858BE|nr:PREDICTED: alkaline phosphatase-like [Sinocyclocheilus rhinocerous]